MNFSKIRGMESAINCGGIARKEEGKSRTATKLQGKQGTGLIHGFSSIIGREDPDPHRCC
jgi:hypothetical protein